MDSIYNTVTVRINKQVMKKALALLVLLLASALHVASVAQTQAKNDKNMEKDKKVLVVFFSHTGENYGVGNISKGNTHIVAEMIAGRTGGTLFEVVPEKEYPQAYEACTKVARKEKEAGARPAVKGDTDVESYDVVFVGYPNWWGDMPMPLYTFLEKHDWKGKTVIPFCTHEGSGLGSTERRLAAVCKGATMKGGLAIQGRTAQNRRKEAVSAVAAWIEKLGL